MFPLKLIISAVTLSCVFSASSFAYERVIEEVSSQSMVLMGQPVENRDSGEVIALVCKKTLPENPGLCTALQFVSFYQQSAFYFGPEFKVTDASKVDEETKAIYKSIRKEMKRSSKSFNRGGIFVLVSAVGISVGSFALIAAAPVVAVPIAVGALVGVILLPKGEKIDLIGSNIAKGSGRALEVTREKNGWNWAGIAKETSRKKFYTLKYSVENVSSEYMNEERSVAVKLQDSSDSCKVQIKGALVGRSGLWYAMEQTGNEVSASRRLQGLAVLNVMQHLADQVGCKLTFDSSADYEVSFTEDRMGRGQQASGEAFRIQLLNRGTQQVIYEKSTRFKYGLGMFSSDLKGYFNADRTIYKLDSL